MSKRFTYGISNASTKVIVEREWESPGYWIVRVLYQGVAQREKVYATADAAKTGVVKAIRYAGHLIVEKED